MFYTVYKITNNINKKYYIGKHQTKDLNDGYMGSGKLIVFAIKKYGQENFTKEILHMFDNEDEMNAKEKELVVISEESYNLCEGGKGGFSYINANLPNGMLGKQQTPFQKERARWSIINNKEIYLSEVTKKKISKAKLGNPSFTGKTHTDESKIKISSAMKNKQSGSKNSQFGTCWVTNGTENKKIKKEDVDKFIFLGYYKGRI